MLMYGWNDDQGNFWNTVVVESWKYQSGEWVVEPGLPDHHLRIVQQVLDANDVRWYSIFDTSLRDSYGDYRRRQANELEPKSRLKSRPEPEEVPAVLERTAFCRGIEWSVLAQTDCESLQGWIHSGNENDRWSPQVWIAIGAGVLSAIALANGQSKQRRNYR
jgi:hypothetical protein